MGDLYEEARLRIENEKLRTVQDAMVKALADREAHSTRPACQVSADPALVAENKKLRDTLRECVEVLQEADGFISNGVECGYIRLPKLWTEDCASETPGIIHDIITRVREVLGDDAN